MPIVQLDPSLIGNGTNGVNAFQNAFANSLKMRAMQQEADEGQYKMDMAREDRAQQNAMARLLASENFDPKSAQGQAQMYGAGGVKNTQGFLKGQGDLAKVNAEVAHKTSETRKSELEGYFKKFELMGQLMGGVSDQGSYDMMRSQASKIPELADLVPNMPPQYDPETIKRGYAQAMTQKDRLAAEHQQIVAAETGRHNLATEGNAATGNQITMRGQDITARGQNMTDVRARETLAQNASAGHYDADRGIMVSKQGVATPVMSGGVPLGAKDVKPTAEYMKQAEAYQNMDDALTGYKKVLSNFDTTSMLNPTKRAEMGTAYQNTLLQAKEIYRLGVMNGPDKQILESIINNPLDVKSIIIPKDALMKQADDLQAIIKRGNDNLAKVNKQPSMALNSQPAQVTDAASYAKLPSGATYVAPNGKTYTKK